MIFRKKREETPLHQAVINRDPTEVQRLILDQSLMDQVNWSGHKPVELARFLGYREIVKLLQPEESYQILVQPKGESMVRLINEDEFKKLFNVEYAPTVRFPDYQVMTDVILYCRSYFSGVFSVFREHFVEKTVPYLEEIRNRKVASVSIRWIDDVLGYGLFAEEKIEEGELIAEYSGSVRRVNRLKPDTNPYVTGYPTIWRFAKYYFVDALEIGKETRFVNHSEKPNAKLDAGIDRDVLHTLMLAKRDIKKGEQIKFDYGEGYWKGKEPPLSI